ncbi:MAG TPA: ABC transporter ATP-binding protein [Anaerolineae bacterium]|jgi:ABC-2 type transport system ATP-binding protein
MAESSSIIETHALSKSFGATCAVESLDLSITRGEIFGLVGPDGAGKTTVLRMLAAILNPTSGRATVASFDTVKQSEDIKRHLGYMSQQFSLYGDLSVLENMNFFADLFGIKRQSRAARIERLLDFSRMGPFRSRRSAQLSGGMQKKLSLACTLIHDPQILLLDEPTTGVDPVSRREFWDILTELRIGGTTIVVSTPYMDEAERCSRVGLMYHGRLIVCDAPDRIRNMVEGELLAVRPDNLQRAATLLKGHPGVVEIQTYGDRLHIFVDDAKTRGPELIAFLLESGMKCAGPWPAQPRMEEAFISLIGKREKV